MLMNRTFKMKIKVIDLQEVIKLTWLMTDYWMKRLMVCISGGPGSKKGKMVYDIAQVFGFNTLNVENIILDELAKKLDEPDPCRRTAQISQLIKVRYHYLS